MTGWQLTAKTIYCEAVDDEVTLLINGEGSASCTGFKKYTDPNEITLKAVKAKNKRLKHPVKCEGESCPQVTSYRGQILAEKTE